MSAQILKSFTFVPQPKLNNDPIVMKRERMVSRLEDQKKLLADPTFIRRAKSLSENIKRDYKVFGA